MLGRRVLRLQVAGGDVVAHRALGEAHQHPVAHPRARPQLQLDARQAELEHRAVGAAGVDGREGHPAVAVDAHRPGVELVLQRVLLAGAARHLKAALAQLEPERAADRLSRDVEHLEAGAHRRLAVGHVALGGEHAELRHLARADHADGLVEPHVAERVLALQLQRVRAAVAEVEADEAQRGLLRLQVLALEADARLVDGLAVEGERHRQVGEPADLHRGDPVGEQVALEGREDAVGARRGDRALRRSGRGQARGLRGGGASKCITCCSASGQRRLRRGRCALALHGGRGRARGLLPGGCGSGSGGA